MCWAECLSVDCGVEAQNTYRTGYSSPPNPCTFRVQTPAVQRRLSLSSAVQTPAPPPSSASAVQRFSRPAPPPSSASAVQHRRRPFLSPLLPAPVLLHTYKPATKRKLGAQPFPRHVGIPAAAARQVSRSHVSLLLHY